MFLKKLSELYEYKSKVILHFQDLVSKIKNVIGNKLKKQSFIFYPNKFLTFIKYITISY